MRRPALISALLCLAGAMTAAPSPETPWRELLLPREELADADNALVRWRPLFPALFPDDPAVSHELADLASPLSVATPSPALGAWLDRVALPLAPLTLRESDRMQYPRIHGPETPFPDHQPLQQLALVRIARLKQLWAGGRHDEAVSLALDNLALSRALLRAQEGLIPLITASGVWQSSLDGVYWLARQPALAPAEAARLQFALLRDDRLAADALIRGFRGEFSFFTRVVLDRLPPTRDVDLLLGGIGSLGLSQPEAPAPEEPHLAVPDRDPLDRDVTLQAAAADVRAWVSAFSQNSRHPRGMIESRLTGYARELPALLRYATQDDAVTPGQIPAANAEVATVENPVGKLFLVITTSNWDAISASVFRREAQRGALTALLAWRRLGRPAPWKDLVTAGLLAEPPADPFSSGPLHLDLKPARIWSTGPDGLDNGGPGDGDNQGSPPDLTWPARPSE